MAQRMLDIRKSMKNVSTQTGNSSEFCIYLSNNKRARFYRSEAYKDDVLAFNINNAKSFIITRSMWKLLRLYLPQIDHLFLNPQ